jgi:hypothetical protein
MVNGRSSGIQWLSASGNSTKLEIAWPFGRFVRRKLGGISELLEQGLMGRRLVERRPVRRVIRAGAAFA